MPVFHCNKIYKPVFTTDASIVDLTGGRGRGGSHFVSDLFLFKITQPSYFRGYFMRLIHGDIRNSLYQEFKDRVEDNTTVDYNDFDFNDSRLEVTYIPTGNKILSKGFKKSQGSATAKLKSIAQATDVIIEECEEIPEDDFNKLQDSLRTKKAKLTIYRVWNPPHKDHWLIKRYYNIVPHPEYDGYYNYYPKGLPGHLSIYGTYKQNIKNINDQTIINFEHYKETNLDHYCSDILGLVSSGAKGIIYKDWKDFEELPDYDFWHGYGLDFGFVNDPTAWVEVFINKDKREIYAYERFYRTQTTNPELIRFIKDTDYKGNNEIICDNAEPSDIAEMQIAGLMAIKTKKGGKAGNKFKQINVVKSFKLFIHKGSENMRFEANNYKWAINPETKEPMNKPEDKNDHLFDALLYVVNYYNRNYL